MFKNTEKIKMVSWQNGFMHLSLKQGDMGSNPIGTTRKLFEI